MNRSRWPIAITLIVSLIVSGLTRQWASYERGRGVAAGQVSATSAANLGRMNSYALALLLGGLRGPLVMFLWPSTEKQKSVRDLEDFDTKIEWIRLLQAEFDSVHIFQIWNKAYNISAQMANIGNKYRTVLDALDYGKSVDAERPNNINIISELGRVYSDKFGTSSEKDYYSQRVRDETQARREQVRITLPASRQAEFVALARQAGLPRDKLRFVQDQADGKVSITVPKPIADAVQPRFNGEGIAFADRPLYTVAPSDRGAQRLEHESLLDAEGNILSMYLKPTLPRPADLAPAAEWNDGSELQYLKQYQPFPYGLSPRAIGYNYYKRAQVLQSVNRQKHSQMSDVQVDSVPPVGLEFWAFDEMERGRRAEVEAFDLPVPLVRRELESTTASIALDAAISYPGRLDEAMYSYRMAARLCDDALVEFERHLTAYKTKLGIFLSHMDEMKAARELLRADEQFLLAMTAQAERRQQARTLAAQHYLQAARLYRSLLVQYFVSVDMAKMLPPGFVTTNIPTTNPAGDAELSAALEKISIAVEPMGRSYESWDEFMDTYAFVKRAEARLRTLNGQ